jgi:hypothetical protein
LIRRYDSYLDDSFGDAEAASIRVAQTRRRDMYGSDRIGALGPMKLRAMQQSLVSAGFAQDLAVGDFRLDDDRPAGVRLAHSRAAGTSGPQK